MFRKLWRFANIYLTNKSYGGPEEGGWYYNTGDVVESKYIWPWQNAEKVLAKLQARCDQMNKEEGNYKPSSVLCTGYYEVFLQAHPGRDYPTEPSTMPKDSWVTIRRGKLKGHTGSVHARCMGLVNVKLGADGPHKLYSYKSVRPATQEEIDRKTGVIV